MIKVYVRKTDRKASDGLYHHYYVEEKTGCIEHFERFNPDGYWQTLGDYMVGPSLFNKDEAIPVKPSECSVSCMFENAGMVISIPSGDDHAEDGISISRFVVDEKINNN